MYEAVIFDVTNETVHRAVGQDLKAVLVAVRRQEVAAYEGDEDAREMTEHGLIGALFLLDPDPSQGRQNAHELPESIDRLQIIWADDRLMAPIGYVRPI